MATSNTGTTINSILEWSNKIEYEISDLYEMSGGNLPNRLKQPIFSLQNRVKRLREQVAKSEFGFELLENFQEICKRSADIRTRTHGLAEEIDERTRIRLLMLATTVSHGEVLLPEIRSENQNASRQHDGLDRLRIFEENLREIDYRIKRSDALTRTTDDRLEKISKDIKTKIDDLLASYANTERQLSEKLYKADQTISHLKEKEEEVETLVGIVSGKSLAGSYSESARAELILANSMRNGSVFLMLTISMIVGYSLLETASPHFDWQTAVFRLVFSIALSVPAAYLSRESTKHRVKQYEFQKISLDLQSISPYLASLPLDEQHKLKSDMAGKIFSPAAASPQQESYPIDIQALLHKIIDKIPQNQANQSDKPNK